MNTSDFPIDRFVFDERVWPRVRRDDERVVYLADILAAGQLLPAVKVQRGSGLVLGGWHTIAAYQRLHRSRVPVEVVDVPESEQLLYAYREDAAAALPYSSADVRSVARRLYQMRSNGHGANVAAIARDLCRAQPTVLEWVKDLVAADAERETVTRQGRVLAAQALVRGAHCKQQRAGELLGVSQQTVTNDIKTNIVGNDLVFETAHALVAETAGRGSTTTERQSANDWLLEQRDPEALAIARQSRALNHALDWTTSIVRQLQGLELAALAAAAMCPDANVRTKHQELLLRLAEIRGLVDQIERSSQ